LPQPKERQQDKFVLEVEQKRDQRHDQKENSVTDITLSHLPDRRGHNQRHNHKLDISMEHACKFKAAKVANPFKIFFQKPLAKEKTVCIFAAGFARAYAHYQ